MYQITKFPSGSEPTDIRASDYELGMSSLEYTDSHLLKLVFAYLTRDSVIPFVPLLSATMLLASFGGLETKNA